MKLAIADAAQDRPTRGLLGGDPDGSFGVAVADQLGAIEGLLPTTLGLAVALVAAFRGGGVGLALTGQSEAAEGVQVQDDRGVEVAYRVGVGLAGGLGELDFGEAVDGVGFGVGGPGQAQLAGQVDVAAVVVLALAAGLP